MNGIWGPALDAEVAYRAEQLHAASRPGRAQGRGTGGAGRADGRSGVRVRGVARVRPDRGWHLPGSGAWHAAR